ncbi:amidohydrolase family protein [Albibacterium indicum]|uniref:amidohydrolase family protein n=1 Tax=Albibacterium indicum TaxID=2292082 RepID=UPI000E54EEEF|nr:amidohydrolase family protein [Pedobacter indicus]
MLIDINAYVGHWPFKQLQYNTCESLLTRMNKFGVNVSVISNLNGIFYKNSQAANRELHEKLRSDKRFSKRFIPFAVINPMYAGWKNDFHESIHKFGMKGLRLYPQYHDYDISDPALVELVKMARDEGIPVAFTIRMVDSRQRSWMDIDYVAGSRKPEWNLANITPIIQLVPDAKYMILNIANGLTLREEMSSIFKKADVLMDTSGRSLNDFHRILNTHGKERFAFGTHAPILDYLTGRLRIDSLREVEADELTKNMIRSENAQRFLGL